jgi:predicted nucleic acid-binding protein
VTVIYTSVWIDYFDGRATRETEPLDSLLGAKRLLIGDLILTEVLQGFRTQQEFGRAREYFELLEFRPMAGREVALLAATNHRELRAIGVTVRKTNDLLIATFCILGNHSLLHCDRDFDAFEQYLGLDVVGR